MVSWVSLFVGVAIGFVIGALAPNKNAVRSKWEDMFLKWGRGIQMDKTYYASFRISELEDDDDEDDESECPSDPISNSNFRLN